MKLIIDISEEAYRARQHRVANPKRMYIDEVDIAIANGTPIPEKPTNGDIIKVLFPNIEIYDSKEMGSVYTGIPFGKYVGANVDCMRDWWDAPYKVSEK